MFKKIITVLVGFCATLSFAAVDVNKATEAELGTITGLGAAKTAKIIEAKKSGNFKDWSDLIKRVNGIGKKNAITLSKAGLTVDGAAFTGTTAVPAKVVGTKAEVKPAGTANTNPVATKIEVKADPAATMKAEAKSVLVGKAMESMKK